MPHLHLPLQSGADSVLKRMSRRCRTDEFRQLVEQARAVKHDFNITTDIIVGFPGETEAEWQQSLDYIDSINFGHVHIFAFSPRAGTKAATLPNPVSREVKRERSQVLHELAEKMKRSNLEKMPGQTVDVLFEGNEQYHDNGAITWSGYTPNFHRVNVTTFEKKLINQIYPVSISSISENLELTGQLAEQ
jgi:threonylcarbamoyladenosine tRNA methylthiotransferase MtaB